MYNDESNVIADQIISIVTMILVQNYINRKTKYLTKHLKDRSVEDDADKRN